MKIEVTEDKAAMRPAGQSECTSWELIMVLLLHIFLRIVACVLLLPVYVVELFALHNAEPVRNKATECDCESCRRQVWEGSTSYVNPLFGQDWSSETYTEEQQQETGQQKEKGQDDVRYPAWDDSQLVPATPSLKGKERQTLNQRRKTALPVRAVARKKPPPKPQRVWR